jgi:hypothetical protein
MQGCDSYWMGQLYLPRFRLIMKYSPSASRARVQCRYGGFAPGALGAYVKAEIAKWTPVVRDAKTDLE